MILNHEQTLMRDTLRAFARERLAPHAADWEKSAA